MTEQEVELEYKSLIGNIIRMFLTDNLLEFYKVYEFAKMRLDKIYDYHYQRLTSKNGS